MARGFFVFLLFFGCLGSFATDPVPAEDHAENWRNGFLVLKSVGDLSEEQSALVEQAIQLGVPEAFLNDAPEWQADFGFAFAEVLERAEALFSEAAFGRAFRTMDETGMWLFEAGMLFLPECNCYSNYDCDTHYLCGQRPCNPIYADGYCVIDRRNPPPDFEE
jgi:hypothetical protein